MKFHTLFLSLLLFPGIAFGQQQPRPGPGQQAGTNRPTPGSNRPGSGANRPAPGMNRPAPGANRPDRGPMPSRPMPSRPMPGRPGGNDRPTPGKPGHGNHRPTPLPSPTPGRPGGPGHGTRPPRPGQPGGANRPGRPGYHRPGEGRPPSFRPIRGPMFRYPQGYRYRRWSIGLLLPHLFLTSPYIYSQWSMLGVEPPPPGYYWVRYGPDLLLVQRGTRRIADVIYGAFL